jgi:hypothetical protein
MKRSVLLVAILSVFAYCFADEYELKNIPKTHYGIWIPKEFDNIITENGNYILAQKSNREKKAHDILVVTTNRIQSDLGFHDGYAIQQNDFNKFVLTIKNQTPIMFDVNKNEYVLVSTAIDDYKTVFINYMISKIEKILSRYSKEKAIYVKNNMIYIRSRGPEYGPFRLLPDMFFLNMNGIDGSKYYFLIYDDKKDIVYGVSLNSNSVEIDAFIEKRVLIGNEVKEKNVEIVRAFSLQ